jgi:hypothetical protein
MTTLDPSAANGTITSLPALTRSREANAASWRSFQEAAEAVAESATATLITRIETTHDPLVLWQIHQELDRRDIPPAFRYPKNESTPQLEFVTWLADVHWFTRRMTGHKPRFNTWRRVFGPLSDTWHESARSIFEFAWRRGNGAAHYTKGFALDDNDRRQLMTIKTTGQIARQRVLKQAAERRAAIASYAVANAARSKDRRPDEITRDRYLIWKTYILADQSDTTTARLFEQIYGETMTRRKVQKQIAAVDLAWREFGPGKRIGG